MDPITPAGIGAETAQALRRHSSQTAGAIESGDPDRIKQLYRDLADDLVVAADHDGSVPVLSYHETAAAVASALVGTDGLHLDVGCGPHPLATVHLCLTSGRPAVGLDIGLGMVSLARQVAREAGVVLHGVVADAERLPFRDAVAGSIICDDTIEHLPDDDAGARELARVSRPDGLVALATPNRRRLPVLARKARDRGRRRRRSPESYFAAVSHLREYTWRDLERLVGPHFDVIDRGHVPWSGSTGARLASRVTATRWGRAIGRVVLLVLSPKA